MIYSKYWVTWILIFTILSWLGVYLHNQDLPINFISPENSIPALISFGLFLTWWRLPNKKIITFMFLFWVFLNMIVGGVLSAIPFSFWPYDPLRTPQHLVKHGIYGLMQIPLIMGLFRTMDKKGGIK
jgi:hypothetical protein